MKNAPALLLRSVTFAYDNAGRSNPLILNDFSYEMAEGECLGIIGPSGCGKSTLAKLALGIEVPTSGTVSLFGKSPEEWYSSGAIGAVFQDPGLIPWLNARKNIELPLNLTPGAAQASAVDIKLLASSFGIFPHLEFSPAELSGGIRARVALARSMVHSPRFLVLDEPFASLDEITSIQIIGHLRDWITQHAASVVLVSHNLDAIARLSDRCLCFPRTSDDEFSTIDIAAMTGLPEERTLGDFEKIRSSLLEKYL